MSWWDDLIAPFAPAKVSGYDFGAPLPPGGWNGNGQSYGWTIHLGTDYGTPAGETIYAAGAGTVTYKTGVPGYGNELIEKLANGFTLIFGHVASGISGTVQQGQPIGVTGHDVGSSKGSVTLVEVLDPSGKAINPDPGFNALFASYKGQPGASSSGTGDLVDLNFPGGSLNVGNPLSPLADVGSAIASIPTSIGHGLADFFVVSEQDIGQWLQKQAIAFFVAAVVLLVLFL